MIIGKNNDAFNKSMQENNNFQKKFNLLKEESKKIGKDNNPFFEDIKKINHSNPNSKHDMRIKSMAMLQERLNQGLITLEEFNKKVQSLQKK